MGEEALPQGDERILDATAQVFAGARTLFAAGIAPHFERAFGDRLALAAEARLVAEQPERGEVGVALFREDALEVRLDPRGAREARVVADDAQRDAVADDAP